MKVNALRRVFLPQLVLLALVGCEDLEVPDLNRPSIDVLESTPSRSAVVAAATGLLIGTRVDVASPTGYVSLLGILGRESYNFDPAEPRVVTEMLGGASLDPGSPAFGGNLWSSPYANIRNAHVLMRAVDKVGSFTAAEREGVYGFAKTLQAHDLLMVINTRDEVGAPIDTDLPLDAVAPIEPKVVVLQRVRSLLDEAEAHLMAAGDYFAFPLSRGFQGFDTPSTFLRFNRGLAARVALYQGNPSQALLDLERSFLDTREPLSRGVYHSFSGRPGDMANGLNNPNIYAHPSLVTDAESRPDGGVDRRVESKLRSVEPQTYRGLTSSLVFTLYNSIDALVPILRNEELVLLRAEALIALGQVQPAAEDINFIREQSGGLAPRQDLDASNILDELLRQKRYSLLFEGGHRWIDLRRYDRLGTLPLDAPDHRVHGFFPIPLPEQDARR